MDSVTQAALGAAVGHAIAKEKGGGLGLAVGAVAGTIPDLDVVFMRFLDPITQIGAHRGLSHSFLFCVVAAPVFGYTVSRFAKSRGPDWKIWTLVGFFGFLTHILLDALTVYGTGWFEPFSDYRVSLNTIFIIDPLFTLPLLVSIIGALVAGARTSRGVRWTRVGLAISTAYLVWGGVAKFAVDRQFESYFAEEGIDHTRFMSAPMPFNTLLWRAVAEVDDGFYESFYSIVSDERPEGLYFISRNDSLLDPLEGSEALETGRWFSNGYYSAALDGQMPIIHDIRFGRGGIGEGPFIMNMAFPIQPDGTPSIVQRWPPAGDPSPLLRIIIDRTF